jgi:alkylation response protein AidB-like acyl-CoA dehydrogenase
MTMSHDRKVSLEAIAGVPLRALTLLSGSTLAGRLNLRRPGERVVYEAVRAGTRAIGAGGAVVRRIRCGEAKRLAPWKSSGLFDLTPTEEQALMRDSMRRFADEVLRPSARGADDVAAPQQDALRQAQGLGLAAVAVPEALGGGATQRSSVAGALIAEELARGDMGLAVAVLAPLAVVQALVQWGTCEQQARYLPRFLGETFASAALAVLEPGPLFDPARLRTRVVHSDGGWTMWGEKVLVPLVASAEFVVVAAEVSGLGPRLFLVERGTPGLTIEPSPAMGLRGAGLGRLRFDAARLPSEALLGGRDEAEATTAVGAVVDRARIAWGAMAVGTARAVLEHVVPYCNDRQAFGEPIANRQWVALLVASSRGCAFSSCEPRAVSTTTRRTRPAPPPSRACSARPKAPRSARTEFSCWEATALPRSTRWNGGIGTSEPSGCSRVERTSAMYGGSATTSASPSTEFVLDAAGMYTVTVYCTETAAPLGRPSVSKELLESCNGSIDLRGPCTVRGVSLDPGPSQGEPQG